jgi:hypothetical protein
MGLWGEYIADYRSKSFILGLEFGRSFLDERLSIDLGFLYADTRDMTSNNPTTPVPTCPTGVPLNAATVNQGCYGLRSGAEYEMGLTVTGAFSSHWFMMLDYRLVADTSGGIIAPGNPAAMPPVPPLAQPNVLTHVLLLRLEARY